MGAGKCRKHQISGVWLARVDLHAGQSLVGLTDLWHIREIQFRIDPMGKHVHRDRDDIHISGALPVSEQRSFDPVSPR